MTPIYNMTLSTSGPKAFPDDLTAFNFKSPAYLAKVIISIGRSGYNALLLPC